MMHEGTKMAIVVQSVQNIMSDMVSHSSASPVESWLYGAQIAFTMGFIAFLREKDGMMSSQHSIHNGLQLQRKWCMILHPRTRFLCRYNLHD
jgi:hypothetical protein